MSRILRVGLRFGVTICVAASLLLLASGRLDGPGTALAESHAASGPADVLPTPTNLPTPPVAPTPTIAPTPAVDPTPAVGPTPTIAPTPAVGPTSTPAVPPTPANVGSAPARSASPGASSPTVRPASTVTLTPPGTSQAGQTINVVASLSSAGAPVPDVSLRLFIDGTNYHESLTDGGGVVSFHVAGTLAAGVHQVVVAYNGDTGPLLAVQPLPSQASGTLTVTPLRLAVETAPSLPGVQFTLDGTQTFVSGPDGIGSTLVGTAGTHTLAVQVQDPNPETRVTFTRWSDSVWTPNREIHLGGTGDKTLGVGLQVSYLTPVRFVDASGRALRASHVSDVKLHGPNGEGLTMTSPSKPVWLNLKAPSEAPGPTPLNEPRTPWRLSSARYNGLDVIFSGQQKFLPGPGKTWTVRMQFYTLRLTARDALFGTGLDRPATLVNAAGRRQQVQLDRQGTVVVWLPSGNYVAHVSASGLSPRTPFSLSRSQAVVIQIVTPLDMLVVASMAVVALVLLLILGQRPEVKTVLRRARDAMPRLPAPRLPKNARRPWGAPQRRADDRASPEPGGSTNTPAARSRWFHRLSWVRWR